MKKIVLVGNPNVGKSVLFRLLTGRYTMVSNFPGTTVEVARGQLNLGGADYEVIDTPGINSLLPQSEEERVTCEILLEEKPDVIVQVADGKNLRRTLLVTTQLVEFGAPMVLVLNMMDEVEDRGIEIDTRGISDLFAIPLVEMVAIYRHGVKQLLQAIKRATVPLNPLRNGRWSDCGMRIADFKLAPKVFNPQSAIRNPQSAIELAGEIVARRNEFLGWAGESFKKKKKKQVLEPAAGAGARIWLAMLALGILIFAWNEIGGLLHARTPYGWANDFITGKLAKPSVSGFESRGLDVLHSILFAEDAGGHKRYGIVYELNHFLFIILPALVPFALLLNKSRAFAEKTGVLTRRPSTGIPILLVVLLLIYEFVGYTGAQTLVGLIEEGIFGRHLVPLLQSWIPRGFLYDLFVGKYGLVSMGLTYSIAIVLPVVTTFFIAFSLLEDSGYFPRLTILSDRVMRCMGLNGKATLPMVLGLGCCTMATMTTRILTTKKERLIATILLALGVPCSAQLGVILGIVSGFSPAATVTIIGVVISQLFLVGFLSSKLIRGDRSGFIFEIPPSASRS